MSVSEGVFRGNHARGCQPCEYIWIHNIKALLADSKHMKQDTTGGHSLGSSISPSLFRYLSSLCFLSTTRWYTLCYMLLLLCCLDKVTMAHALWNYESEETSPVLRLSVLGVCAQQHKITDPVVTGRLLATSCPLASSWSTPLYCQGIDSTQSGKSYRMVGPGFKATMQCRHRSLKDRHLCTVWQTLIHSRRHFSYRDIFKGVDETLSGLATLESRRLLSLTIFQ